MANTFHDLLREIYETRIITPQYFTKYFRTKLQQGSIQKVMTIHIWFSEFDEDTLTKILEKIRLLEIETNIHSTRHIIKDLERIYDFTLPDYTLETLLMEENIIEILLQIFKKISNNDINIMDGNYFNNNTFYKICEIANCKLENNYSIDYIEKTKIINELYKLGNNSISIDNNSSDYSLNDIILFKDNIINIKNDIEKLQLSKFKIGQINLTNVYKIIDYIKIIKIILEHYPDINKDLFEEMFLIDNYKLDKKTIISKFGEYYKLIDKNILEQKTENELLEIYKNKFMFLQNFDDLLNLDILFGYSYHKEHLIKKEILNYKRIKSNIMESQDFSNFSAISYSVHNYDKLINEGYEKLKKYNSLNNLTDLNKSHDPNNRARRWVKYVSEHIYILKLSCVTGMTDEQKNETYKKIQQKWEKQISLSEFKDIHKILVAISISKSYDSDTISYVFKGIPSGEIKYKDIDPVSV